MEVGRKKAINPEPVPRGSYSLSGTQGVAGDSTERATLEYR